MSLPTSTCTPLTRVFHHLLKTQRTLSTALPITQRTPPSLEMPGNSENLESDEESNQFEVKLDVQSFTPEEITVKTAGRCGIHVEAKHRRRENSGFVTRHFVRRFNLPEGIDSRCVISNLSPEGILTISVPKENDPSEEEKIIDVKVACPNEKNQE